MTRGGRLLVIDTATTRAVIAVGEADGALVAERNWVAGYRHGEELLARLESLLADCGMTLADLGAIVTGTGPGAFTGLRVGIATAKGLAHAARLPIVGISTGTALLEAVRIADGAIDAIGGRLVLLQPAGQSDRVVTRPGLGSVIVAGGVEPVLAPDERLVAVDLEGRAPVAAVALGETAYAGLAGALLGAGAARLAAGDTDDLAGLVPEYVTLPRGVLAALPDSAVDISGGMARP